METTISKIFRKIIRITGHILFIALAGYFGMLAICLLIVSFVDVELLGVIAAIACAFVASLCWTIRKDL